MLLFKSKLLWKISFDDESLTKLQRESEDSRGMVLARPSVSQTRGLTLDFKGWRIHLQDQFVSKIEDPGMWIRNVSTYFFKDFKKVNHFKSFIFYYHVWLLIIFTSMSNELNDMVIRCSSRQAALDAQPI